jgi:hypothetical protein
VSRRANLIVQNVLFGASTPLHGPMVTAVAVDAWNPGWGDYHLGYGAAANVCGSFFCGGVRVTFDQVLTLQPQFGNRYGFPNGFELLDATGTQVQNAELTGIRVDDPHTLQLNFTWAFGSIPAGPVTLRHAWHDYPTILVFGEGDLPALPFNITLPKPT